VTLSLPNAVLFFANNSSILSEIMPEKGISAFSLQKCCNIFTECTINFLCLCWKMTYTFLALLVAYSQQWRTRVQTIFTRWAQQIMWSTTCQAKLWLNTSNDPKFRAFFQLSSSPAELRIEDIQVQDLLCTVKKRWSRKLCYSGLVQIARKLVLSVA
jgi:hypothetical protein